MTSTRFGKRVLKDTKLGIPIFVFFFIIIPLLFSLIIGNNIYDIFAIFILIFFSTIIISELFFRFIYRLYFNQSYKIPPKIPFKKLHVESHPYLPFIYKKNFASLKATKLNYPLQNKNYFTPQLKTNNYGFINGPNGNRKIQIPKPKKLIRINCIGGSTTGNYVSLNNHIYSYPLELEKILNLKSSKKIEVNNCGQGGYNSADLLVRFSLQIIDTEPNYLIIYHGFNDIKSYLTPFFMSDYSHSRKNLGESYWKFYISSKIFIVPLKFINYILNFWFPYNIRNSLLDVIAKGQIDIKSDFSQGLKTYQRNIQQIIDLCAAKKIKVILSTFCYYLHDSIKEDPLSILFEKIVKEENKIIKKIAKKNKLKLVDSATLIPKNNLYFLDSMHFTPEGMNLLAKNISNKIIY